MGVMLLSFSAVTLVGFITSLSGGEVFIEWEAYSSSSLRFILLLVFDYMSLLFLSTVGMIAGGVFIYSGSYMSQDKVSSRFSLLVMSFVVSMFLMILSPNLISLLLGWDGLGVTSYLLVCYYSSEKSFNASMLTALTNRLGDVAILLAIALWFSGGFFNYGISSSASAGFMSLGMFLIILAAMTKSAQIPFSAWLPAAMAAPTPVSALVHSSTLVTAGVYLLIRFNYAISTSGYMSWVLMLGMLTMTMAGGSALMELDMKKIIALSTLSQLGVMFFSLGLGQPFITFFHLVSHAYFKAMLFMAAGAAIHSMKDYQDLRKMGGYHNNHMMIGSIMMISNLSLCGLPFMSGFYSKDMILEVFMLMEVNIVWFFISMFATLLTMAYSCRFALSLFTSMSQRESMSGESDTDFWMFSGMLVLVAPSIMGGWWLSGVMPASPLVYMAFWMKLFILVMILSTGVIMIMASVSLVPDTQFKRTAHMMWFMPKFISSSLTQSGLSQTKKFFKFTDPSWVNFSSWKWLTVFVFSTRYVFSLARMGMMISLLNVFVLVVL